MDRKQMLNLLAEQEIQKMNDLSDSAFLDEICSWFDEAIVITPTQPRGVLMSDYTEDYMRWQEDKSDEELKELINNQK